MEQRTDPRRAAGAPHQTRRLSYKFQRIREQIRGAILGGEFEARLPGERELARRYRANAKTVNKALGDLCSEGLLVREIGRGTYLAAGNGRRAAASGRRTFRCLLPSEPSANPYRADQVNEVGAAITANGHDWEDLSAEPADGSGAIPLAGWPTLTRHATDGILCYPSEPLSYGIGQLSEALVAETFRRHVPVVVQGARAPSAKLNAVVPDYVDAGFHLTDFLFRIGCENMIVLRSGTPGPEVAMILSGCRAAASRHHRSISEAVAPSDNDAPGLGGRLAALLDKAGQPRDDGGALPTTGVVCVGSAALEVAMANQALESLQSTGLLALVCVTEPGDGTAEAAGITSYEVNPKHITAWAARLLLEARPGQTPVEVIVPGSLRVRGVLSAEGPQRGLRGATGAVDVPSVALGAHAVATI
ncbi:MAG: GntR family transcriptional regulator [Phycisphaerae bacterium]|nr:GntR family transcriptional regulator [Phycisphaerae bacterium]